MTALREAAQQALEALELAQTDVHWELNSPTRKFLRKAEKALRSALAEPVQKPVQEPLCWAVQALEALEWIEPSVLRAALAKPGQEPYAWMAVGGSIWRHKTSEDDVPLYTTPPQRKPLTEEEIRRIYDTHRASVPLYHAIARAIERAHGIGGDGSGVA